MVNEKFSCVLHSICFSQEEQGETVWQLISLVERQTGMLCYPVLSAVSIHLQLNTHNRSGCPNGDREFSCNSCAVPLRRYCPRKQKLLKKMLCLWVNLLNMELTLVWHWCDKQWRIFQHLGWLNFPILSRYELLQSRLWAVFSRQQFAQYSDCSWWPLMARSEIWWTRFLFTLLQWCSLTGSFTSVDISFIYLFI